MKKPPLTIRVIEDPEQLAVPRLREVVFAMHLPHPPPAADDMRPVERDGGMAGWRRQDDRPEEDPAHQVSQGHLPWPGEYHPLQRLPPEARLRAVPVCGSRPPDRPAA